MRLFCNMREIITSTKNATVKLARSLAEKKFREEHGLFLVEGGNIVKDIPAGTEVEFYLVSESRAEETAAALALTRAKVYYVTDAVMKSLSDTVTPYGLAAAVKIPERQFALPDGNAILLDGVSDPGNLGTVIRTAAAAGFGDVYLLGCADPYSGKAVRASMGGIFRVRVTEVSEEQAVALVVGTSSVTLDMGGENILAKGLRAPVTLVAGSEAHGVRKIIADSSEKIGSLPMQGGMESLNVAIAAAVAMYSVK